ncbi:ABC-2 type transport system ATP-binding protein/Cu-processing system ATP-binding protein [Rathayibacter sp. PhB127]|nr:ABC-2 type transport system ATP-binding protein/Cu-processing system ATP-binding protein [Rathayibacter sp. PhB127]
MPDNDTPRLLLDVRSLGKRMGSVDVLRDVSFTIDAGEVVGLVGPNGAGKTTLMRTLAGLYEPSHGSALVLGHAIGTTEARRALSLMPEEPDLYPGLSVVEHVRLIERLSGSPRNESLGPSLLERYGLSDKHDLLPHQLSQGMRRKLALVLALLKGAGLLLLDEPFNGLDAVSVRELRNEVRRLAEEGCGVLLSMHGLTELERIADRAVILHAGRIAHIARLGRDDLEGQPPLEDVYLRVVGALRDDDD